MTLARPVVVLVAATLALVGCTRNAPSTTIPAASGGVPTPLTIASVDFPSAWLVEQVGGDGVDAERIPADAVAGTDADLFAYVPGLDPVVDEAAASLPEDRVIDLTDDVSTLASPRDPDVKDPYVWFDPVNVATMSQTLATAMSESSPTPFEAYQYYGLRALAVQADARQVDQRLQEILNPCRIATLVVEAPVLTYFARGYGFDQVPLILWKPRRHPVTTLYYTLDAQPAVKAAAAASGTGTVALDTFTQAAPDDDLLQGVLDTAERVADHQDCPLVTPSSTDRPG